MEDAECFTVTTVLCLKCLKRIVLQCLQLIQLLYVEYVYADVGRMAQGAEYILVTTVMSKVD